MSKTVSAIFLFVFWLGLVTGVTAQAPSEKASADEYQVYSAILNHKFEGELGDLGVVKMLVIREDTVPEMRDARPDNKFVKEMFPEIKDMTLSDFNRATATKAKLTRSFVVRRPYALLSNREHAAIQTDARWDLFDKKHPNSGGFFTFSRVGFDSSRQQAFLYLEHVCRGLCSSGHYIFLKKEGQVWRVVGSWMPWIS